MSYVGQVARIPAGRGSLNYDQNMGAVPVTDLRQAEGITVEDGTWRKAGGATKLDSAGISGAPKVIAVHDWFPSAGVQALLSGALDGKLYKEVGDDLDSVTLITGLSTTARPGTWVDGGLEAAGNNKKCFYFNGSNVVQVLSGNGIVTTDIALPPADWAAGNQPIHGAIHQNSLWGYGNLNDPHRIYKSLNTNHESFTGTPYSLSLYPGVGERLVFGVVFKKLLFLFKRARGVFYLDDSDTSSANWGVKQLTTAIGIAGPGAGLSISTSLGDDVLFLSPEGGVYLLSAIDPTSGSIANADLSALLHIDTFIRQNVNLNLLGQAVSVWYPFKKKALFGVARVGSSEHNMILEFDFSRVAANGKPTFSYSYRDEPLSLGLRRSSNVDRPIAGDDAGNVYKLDQDARSKDAVGYIGKYQIPQTDFGFVDPAVANKKKNFDWLELAVNPMGDYNLSVDIIHDGKYKQTLNFNMGGGSNTIGSFVIGTDVLGGEQVANKRKRLTGDATRWAAIGYNSGAGQDFSVAEHLVGFRPGHEGP